MLENWPVGNVDVELLFSTVLILIKHTCLLYLLHLYETFGLLVITCYLQNTDIMSFYMCNHFSEEIKHLS